MTDFTILGGGLIGMLTARYLAQAGATVALYDRQAVAQESTWAGGGILSPLYPWRYLDSITELARWSQQHYEGVAAELQAESGIDPEYRRSGLLMLGISDTERDEAQAWAARFGYEMALIEPHVVMRLQPGVCPFHGNALWMPEVAQLRNPRLAQSLRGSLERYGVVIHEQCPVDDIVIENGAVRGIRAGNKRIDCRNLIVAGGAWSGEILRQAGLALPVAPVRGQMLLYRAEPGLLEHIILADDHYVIPRADGRILVGSTLEFVGFDKQTTADALAELSACAVALFPPLRKFPIEKQWAGLRPGTADGVPFIGPCPGIGGLWVNAGHYRNGVVTGLASARLLADMLLQRPPIIETAPYAITPSPEPWTGA